MQRLQLRESVVVLRGRRATPPVPLQGSLPPEQPHSPAEHLDDLRSLSHADMHEPHRAHPPTVPAGDEAARAHDDRHRGVRTVHAVEQEVGEAGVSLQVEIRVLPLSEEFVERCRVADIDDAEGRSVRDSQVQFSLPARQIDDAETPGPVEQGLADLGVEAVFVLSGEVREPAEEVVAAPCRMLQPRVTAEKLADHAPRDGSPGQEPAEEVQDPNDIGARFAVGAARPAHGLSQEHPERLAQVEVEPLRVLLPVEPGLLVEGQQAPQQVHVAVRVFHAGRQVGDRVVLPVPVGVELPIAVVEEKTARIGDPEILVLSRHLIEGGRILDGEPPARQFGSPLPPDLPRRAQMPLVHEDQVVVAELAHGDAFHPLLVGEFVDVQDLYRTVYLPPRPGIEPAGAETALPHLALVLGGHLLRRGQEHDVVQPRAGSLEVVLVLHDVRVHQERLAGPGRALDGEGSKVLFPVLREPPPPAIAQ